MTKEMVKRSEKTPPRKASKDKPAAPQTGRPALNKIGVLWLKDGQNGKFMSGRIELSDGNEMCIFVFKNGYKENASHPDYVIFEPENEEAKKAREAQAAGKGKATHDDSDIPF
jgi:hypothetical protein